MIERFLGREQAPLDAGQWQALDRVVVETVRSTLVGRRFIPLYGPLGPGVQTVPLQELESPGPGAVDLTGEPAGSAVRVAGVRHLALPMLYKDFLLLWRNIASSQQLGLPLDVAPAAGAAAALARAEDDLIFNGHPGLGLPGLLTVPGRQVLPLADWGVVGNAFADVTRALHALTDAGFFGPYALAVPPRLYAQMHGVHERTGTLEIRNVEELTTAGVYRSPAVPEDRALVVATGAQNLDLAVAQDTVTAALGPERMNHLFRVLEVLALRIKRPQAVVTLEGAPP